VKEMYSNSGANFVLAEREQKRNHALEPADNSCFSMSQRIAMASILLCLLGEGRLKNDRKISKEDSANVVA